MSRRRVLLVVDALEVGGVASHLTSTMGRLSRSRFDLRVANLGPSTSLSDQLRLMKVRVYDLGVSGMFSLPRRVIALRKLLKNLNVDVIHSYGHAGPVARFAAGDVPVVSTLPEPGRNSGGLGGRLRVFLERGSAARAARLVVPSENMRKHFTDDWGVEVAVVPNFLDVPWFRGRVAALPRQQARTRLGVSPEEVVLLHMGRGGEGKGLEVLLEAFQVARVEDPKLRLFLTGEESGMAGARTQAESLGLSDSVVFLGTVADVAPLYSAADLFLLPSHQEGWSMALLEAMVAGLPAITSRAGAIPELASEATAMLVESNRPEDLARAIVKLSLDPRGRAGLGAAAAARASELDVTVWAPRLEQLYSEVIRATNVT